MFDRLLRTVSLVPLFIFLQKGKLHDTSSSQHLRPTEFTWTLDKGISGILEFFLRLRWRSLLTLPSCIQPFLDEPVMVLVPISLYVLELFPWWVCYSDAHVYWLILCTLLICFYFCGQLAWCKNKDLYSWYLHTFSSARLLWGQKKACLTRWREHKTKKKIYRNRLI